MIKLLKYLSKKDVLFTLSSVVFIVAQVFLDLKVPEYMSTITGIATGGNQGSMQDIWVNGGFMLLCALGSLICSIITGWFVAKVAADYSANLRGAIYDKVQTFSFEEINKFNTASLITRATNDVTQIQMLVAIGVQMLIKAPVTAVWAIIKIAGKQWQWSVATAIAVVVILLGIVVITFLVMKKFKKMQLLTDDMNRVTRENLSGIRVVRAYNAEDYQQKKFASVNDEITKTSLFTGRTTAFIGPVMSLVMNGLSIAIYWIGAIVINNAATQPAAVALYKDMIVFSSYGMQIVSSFMMLTMVFMMGPRALVSARRVSEVLDTHCSIIPGAGVGETQEKGTIEFNDVSFRYPDGGEDVLSHITFTANKGETVAFIGSTGCGKSTIVNLVPRFYDATSGSVKVDGHDVKEYKKDELNKRISYVSQKAVLFSGDIKSNIDFGDNDATDEEVQEAVRIAQSSDFVEAQEGGYEGRVAQNGSNFSGGQKQRLSIARAVARRAEIYIFDDTFSALDYKTDKNLRAALKQEIADATMLIVAQRIGTIMDADKIIVLDDGKIVGAGKHDELLKTCPTYLDIAKSQLSEEELKNA